MEVYFITSDMILRKSKGVISTRYLNMRIMAVYTFELAYAISVGWAYNVSSDVGFEYEDTVSIVHMRTI